MRKPTPPPGAASGSAEPNRSETARAGSARPGSETSAADGARDSEDEERTAEIDISTPDVEDEAERAASGSTDSLIWPPPDEELNGWEILQFESTGRTLIEPMCPVDESRTTPMAAPAASSRGPDTPPPAPRLYSTIPTPAAALPLPNDEGLSIDRSLRVDRPVGVNREPPVAYERDAHPGRTPTRDERSALFQPTPSQQTSSQQTLPPYAALAHDRDENLPETQVIEPLLHAEWSGRTPTARSTPPPATPLPQPIAPTSAMDPLAPTPARPMAASARPPQSPPARPHPAPPQIIVQGGAHPPAGSDVPTEARLSARDQTEPRVVASPIAGRPGPHITVHPGGGPNPGAGEVVDPAALTRIMPLPKDLARSRVPASMIETLRDDHRRDTQASLASHDPLATNVWPSSPAPLAPGAFGRPDAGSGLSGPTRAWSRHELAAAGAITAPQPVFGDAVVVANRRSGLPLWRIALIVIALVAIAEVAYLVVRTMRPSAAASLATPGGEASAPASTANPTPSNGAATGANTGTPATDSAAPAAAPSARTTAALEVRSDPAGAHVSIDGVDHGQTPIVVSGLAPGRRQVRVSGPFPTIIRHITLRAGQQGAISVAPRPPDVDRSSARPSSTGDGGAAAQVSPGVAGARPAPVGRGWLTIDSPLVLRVVRNGDFLGTSEDGRIPLPAGTHEIALENESVNFREVRRVDVPVNRGVAMTVPLPQGVLNINAVPWAEVFIDGQRIGETPVSQFALPIGPHEILYRHPQHGDRRVTVIVKVGTPGRTFVDFTK
jgi:PEGA domain